MRNGADLEIIGGTQAYAKLVITLADTILHHPEIDALKIVGHTDTQGDDLHNQDLSERRAGSVARALRDRGVQIPLAPSGEGERQPLCQETTPACHAQNRRVEFLIVEG
mgnify:CR=1 FL=1